MRVQVVTVFNCPAEKLFSELLQSRSLHYVATPLIRFKPISDSGTQQQLPAIWQNGSYPVQMYLLGFIYLGKQRINIKLDTPAQQLLDAGEGTLIKQWHHLITITPASPTRTRYTDTVTIKAGPLTPIVWGFAQVFYRHRQRRWRRLIRNGFNYDS